MWTLNLYKVILKLFAAMYSLDRRPLPSVGFYRFHNSHAQIYLHLTKELVDLLTYFVSLSRHEFIVNSSPSPQPPHSDIFQIESSPRVREVVRYR